MKMANLHLFAFSSFCAQCAKVSSPSLFTCPPPRHLHFFSVSQAHSSFCLSSFWFRFVSASSFLPFCGLFTRHIFHKNESSELATYLHTRQVCLCVCVECVRELSTRHRTVNLMVILNKAMKTAN